MQIMTRAIGVLLTALLSPLNLPAEKPTWPSLAL